MRYRTAKIALPCSQPNTHGKEIKHGKIDKKRTAMRNARQRPHKTHGKDPTHGNKGSQPTAKKSGTAKVPSLAVRTLYALRASKAHDKVAFAMRLDVVHGKGALCRAVIPLPCAI
jgi:hypothetical protein